MVVVVVLVALGHTLHVHDTRAVGRKSGLLLAHVGGFWTAGLQLESGGAEAVVLRYPWLLIRAKFHALSFTLHRISSILIGLCCILGVAALMEFSQGREHCAVSSHGFVGHHAFVIALGTFDIVLNFQRNASGSLCDFLEKWYRLGKFLKHLTGLFALTTSVTRGLLAPPHGTKTFPSRMCP